MSRFIYFFFKISGLFVIHLKKFLLINCFIFQWGITDVIIWQFSMFFLKAVTGKEIYFTDHERYFQSLIHKFLNTLFQICTFPNILFRTFWFCAFFLLYVSSHGSPQSLIPCRSKQWLSPYPFQFMIYYPFNQAS